jgi:hypothetical protein
MWQRNKSYGTVAVLPVLVQLHWSTMVFGCKVAKSFCVTTPIEHSIFPPLL